VKDLVFLLELCVIWEESGLTPRMVTPAFL
jgi:hypothetical protein